MQIHLPEELDKYDKIVYEPFCIFEKNNFLENLSFSLQPGEFSYLIGKTGSGKSSILRSIYCDVPIQSGNCIIDGVCINNIKKSKVPLLRRKIGIIFQDFKLLSDRTVFKNLEFVLKATEWNDKSKINERIDEVLDQVKMNDFKNKFPDRFFQIGIAEANMIGIAAGMTIGEKIPYTGTFANFSTGRVYDQIRQSVAYSNKNVKICASHAGITLGEDGATHQILEDIGLMKMLPGMTVINPCDYNQTKLATIEISKFFGPVYLRFGRPKVPLFTDLKVKFEIGKGIILKKGRGCNNSCHWSLSLGVFNCK